jgi:LPXTG-motif cell wall-anchored protein
MKRLGMVLVATLVVVMGLALAGPASAGTACYPSCPTTGRSNGAITGAGWCPGSDVTISVDGDVVGTETVAGDGTFSFDLPTSVDLTVDHTITVEGLQSDCTTPFTDTFVLGAEGTNPGGGTAFTGANISIGLVALGALMIVGAGALLASRRRDHAK